MVKHTQTIRWREPMNRLSVFDNFVGLALKGLNALKLHNDPPYNYAPKEQFVDKLQIQLDS